MNYAAARSKLETGKVLAVPRQVSWRVAQQLTKQGVGTLDMFVNRWCAILRSTNSSG